MQQPAAGEQLFVYGSLRKGFNSPVFELINRYFELVAPGKIRGKLYDLGEYPAAIPTSEDSFIIGELYRIKHTDELNWALAQIDDYEGIYDNEDGYGPLYKREEVTVYPDAGQPTTSWVYWYARSIEGKPIIPSGDVLQYMKEKMK